MVWAGLEMRKSYGGIWKYVFGSLGTVRTNGFGVSGNTLWLGWNLMRISRELREL